MKRKGALLLFAAIGLFFCLHFQSALGYAQTDAIAKVDNMLSQSGYTFVKKAGNVWVIDFSGKSLSSFKVIITTDEEHGLMVMFVTVAKKADFQPGFELMYKLARLNNRLDRIKAGIDDDGDIFVRIDISARILDVKEFKLNVEQLAAAADETFADIKQFIMTAK